MKTGLHHLLRDMAHARPANPALTSGDDTLDYAQLWGRVQDLAASFRALGLKRHDRVAIFLDKRPETVVAIFAATAAGGIFVPLNPLLKGAQVAHILHDSGSAMLVTSPERLTMLAPLLETLPELRTLIIVDGVGSMPAPLRQQAYLWSDLPQGTNIGLAEPPDTDLAAILYTSGSTGRPKGVALSHRNLLAGAESVSCYLENSAEDVILAALPLSFDAGLSQLTTAFAVGAHVILHNYIMAQGVPQLCARYGVTGITAVPPLWIQLGGVAWPDAMRSRLRYFANTGGRMPRPLLGQLRSMFPRARPFLMYGLTEAFRSTYLDPDEVDSRPDSIGKAIPNVEILVVRPDGSECAVGEEGELVHRGALVAQGYWNDPGRSAQRFRPVPGRDQPWRSPELAVFSGDIVKKDQEGFLYYVGRHDEMIKTSGYRISPTEIEEAAFETRLVRDAVALGIDDDRLGQRVVLFASPANGGPLDRIALLNEMKQRLPLYMVPSEILERASIPRSPNGKFDRVLLREELRA